MRLPTCDCFFAFRPGLSTNQPGTAASALSAKGGQSDSVGAKRSRSFGIAKQAYIGLTAGRLSASPRRCKVPCLLAPSAVSVSSVAGKSIATARFTHKTSAFTNFFRFLRRGGGALSPIVARGTDNINKNTIYVILSVYKIQYIVFFVLLRR